MKPQHGASHTPECDPPAFHTRCCIASGRDGCRGGGVSLGFFFVTVGQCGGFIAVYVYWAFWHWTCDLFVLVWTSATTSIFLQYIRSFFNLFASSNIYISKHQH